MRNYLLISLDAYLVMISAMQTVDPTPDYNNLNELEMVTSIHMTFTGSKRLDTIFLRSSTHLTPLKT